MRNNEVIKARLVDIASRNGGRVTPDDVVEDAKRKDSPLHDLFEWDVKKAAARHWIETAREIISSVKVVVTVDHISVKTPFYVRDPQAGAKDQGYVSAPSLRSDKDSARMVLVTEFQRVADLLRRSKHLSVALGLQDEVDELIDRVVGLRDKAK